jgi:hypothetical protein
MPPHSAFDEEQIALTGHSQHSSVGVPAVSQVPKPLTEEEHDDEQDEEPVRKEVFFSNQIRIRLTLHVRDYTQEEIEATWFSKTDFENIKADVRFDIGLLHEGTHGAQDTTSFCRRGLECRTKEGMRKRMSNKIIARNAVLDEQDRQWANYETDDAEAIAKVYIAASPHLSRISARRTS